MGHFKGYSKGAKTFFFLSPKLSRAQGGTLDNKVQKQENLVPGFWDNDTIAMYFTYFA
jgi:hypothetical protein